MAIVYKSSGQVNRGNTATPALDKPGDLANGDFLICAIAHDNAVASITDTPSGWQHIGSQDAPGSDAGLRLFYKYITNAAGEPSSWTWTFGASKGGTIVSYLSFTGVNSTTPIDVTSVFGAPTGTTTPTAGPITPVTNGAMLAAFNATDPSSGTYTGTPTSGWDERIQFGVSATSNLYAETFLQSVAGSITAAPTMSGTDDYATGIVALRPASTVASLNSVIVEIAFGVEDAMIFGEGVFGTDAFGGTLVWTDVTEYVRSGSTFRGISRMDTIFASTSAGNLTVVLSNEDARFDPTNLDGPYVDGDGNTQVLPMKQIRVRAVTDTDIYLWRGYILDWSLSYPGLNHDSTCTVTAVDGISVLSSFNGPQQADQGGSETTGARITRILNNASWPTSMRDIATGVVTVQPTNLSQPAWSEMQLTSDTEVGELYMDGNGNVIFRDVFAIFTDTRSTTPQATFADDGTGLKYEDVQVVYDATQITNMVRIGREDGSQQTAEDYDSQAKYQIRTYERSDLLYEDDFFSQQTADFILFVFKDPELKLDNLVVNPLADPANLFPQCWEREFGDRISITFTPIGRDTAIERDCYIRGIRHEWTPKTWKTTWVLQDTTRYDDWATEEGL